MSHNSSPQVPGPVLDKQDHRNDVDRDHDKISRAKIIEDREERYAKKEGYREVLSNAEKEPYEGIKEEEKRSC